MMAATRIEALTDAACKILEEQVFMFGEPCDKLEVDYEADTFLKASVMFDGPVSGTFFWSASKGFCVELAANMLGIESDDEMAQAGYADALKELINVICCRFLTSVYGSEPIFHLNSPVSEKMKPAEWGQYIEHSDTLGIWVDDHLVLLGVTLTNQ